MSTQAKAVLWIGLILITAQLVSKWSEIRSIIFTNTSGGASGSGGGNPSNIPGIINPHPFGPGSLNPFEPWSFLPGVLSNTSPQHKAGK